MVVVVSIFCWIEGGNDDVGIDFILVWVGICKWCLEGKIGDFIVIGRFWVFIKI